MSDLARKKLLKRWPAYLMRFLPLTSPDIPLPFQRGLKMLIIFLCVFHGIELLKVRIRVVSQKVRMFSRGLPRLCVTIRKEHRRVVVSNFQRCKGTANEKSTKK